jgi:hypothetical protein
MADLRWFRVETDSKGRVLSVSLVECAGTDEKRVFYVPAGDEDAARELGRKAFNAYAAARNRENRARLRAEGRCDCGRERDLPGKNCSVCLQKSREYDARALARKHGENVPPADWKGSRDARRAADAEALRLSVLEEVDQVWRSKGAVGLRIWLRRELARLGKGRAA